MWNSFVDQMAGIIEGNPVPTVYLVLILFGLGAIGWAF
jgi:hypothetical protein